MQIIVFSRNSIEVWTFLFVYTVSVCILTGSMAGQVARVTGVKSFKTFTYIPVSCSHVRL